MKQLIDILHKGHCSCVIEKEGKIYQFTRKGIADLYDIYHSTPQLLQGASVADKIIGKAAAALLVLGGVSEVYADIISASALHLLQENHIATSFNTQTEYIRNRHNDGWCPMEQLCAPQHSPSDIYQTIEQFINQPRTKQPVITI